MDKSIEIILTETGLDEVNAKLEQASRKITGIRTKTKGLGTDLTKLGAIASQNIKLSVTINGIGASKQGTGAYGQVSKLKNELSEVKKLLNDIGMTRAFKHVPGFLEDVMAWKEGKVADAKTPKTPRVPGAGRSGTRREAGANTSARLAAGLRFAGAFPGGGVLSGIATPLAGAGSALGVLPGAAGLAATTLITLAASAGLAAKSVISFSTQAVTLAGSVQSASMALAALRDDGASLARELRELALRTPGLNPQNALELGTRFAATGASRDTILQAVTIAARAGALSQGNQQDMLGIKNALGDILSGNLTGQELRQLANAGGGGALILRELSAIAGGRDKITSLEVNTQLFKDLAARVSKVAMPMDSLAAVSERLGEAYGEVLLVLGDQILPSVVEAATGFIDALEELKGGAALKELGAEIATTVTKLSELAVEALPSLIEGAKMAAAAMRSIAENPGGTALALGGGLALGGIAQGALAGLGMRAVGAAGVGAGVGAGAASGMAGYGSYIAALLGISGASIVAVLAPLALAALAGHGIAKWIEGISDGSAQKVEDWASLPFSSRSMMESQLRGSLLNDAEYAAMRNELAGGTGQVSESLPSLARKQLKQLEIISANTANFRSDMDATLLDLHDLRTRRGGGSVVQSESFGGTNVMERMARANAHASRRLNERQLTYAAL